MVSRLRFEKVNNLEARLLNSMTQIGVLEAVVKAFIKQAKGIEVRTTAQHARAGNHVGFAARVVVPVQGKEITRPGILVKQGSQAEQVTHHGAKMGVPFVREASLHGAVRFQQLRSYGANREASRTKGTQIGRAHV